VPADDELALRAFLRDFSKGTAQGTVDSQPVEYPLAGRIRIMAKAFPEEFRRDVVAVARKREAPINQVARDFGISEATLHNWLKRADVEQGVRPGLTVADAAELRELKKRNRLLEQENEVLRRAAVYLGRGLNPK
jgi:transposase-like protein